MPGHSLLPHLFSCSIICWVVVWLTTYLLVHLDTYLGACYPLAQLLAYFYTWPYIHTCPLTQLAKPTNEICCISDIKNIICIHQFHVWFLAPCCLTCTFTYMFTGPRVSTLTYLRFPMNDSFTYSRLSYLPTFPSVWQNLQLMEGHATTSLDTWSHSNNSLSACTWCYPFSSVPLTSRQLAFPTPWHIWCVRGSHMLLLTPWHNNWLVNTLGRHRAMECRSWLGSK